MAILSLDLGTKWTGVALSAGSIATAYATLDTAADLMAQIARICQDESVDLVVVGLPLNEDGTPSAQAEWVKLEVDKLHEFLKLPIVLEDEVLTTVEARRILTEMGQTPEQIDRQIDQESARLILQQYLNNRQELES